MDILPTLHDALIRKTSIIYLIGNIPAAVLNHVSKYYPLHKCEDFQECYARVYERLPVPLYSPDDSVSHCIEIFYF